MVVYIVGCGMKFAKWGNSIAIRVPAEVVAKLGISPDEEAQIVGPTEIPNSLHPKSSMRS